MKAGTENKRKLAVASVLGVLALGCAYYLYDELFAGPSAPAPVTVSAPVVVPASAGRAVSATRATASSAALGATEAPGYVVGGRAAQQVGTSSGALDPTLHEDAMLRAESVVYSGSGRNIFAGGAAAAPVALKKIVQPIAPARPVSTPSPVIASGPPPPPPIDLKFFGVATTANGTRRAFLLHGDDVFLASTGDVVQRRYRVVGIAANTITIEDMPNSNKQTLPLLQSP